MDVADFQFELPDELIAQEAAPRGTSRLLVLDRGTGAIRHAHISDLPLILRAGDLLVVNNTRVFAARLLGRRFPSGGAVECLLLAPPEPDLAPPEREGEQRNSTDASRIPDPRSRIAAALMHPGQKLKPGARVRFEGPAGVLMAEVLERHFYGRRTIRLWAESAPAPRSGEAPGAAGDVDSLVDALGHVPLPPYIRRGDTVADRDRYQTVFARERGSVAAPTAGLHFDDALLASLTEHGIERAAITLHVGYGTFKPVRAQHVEEHVVDPERYEISAEAAAAITRARDQHRRVIAVGTTTTRALEEAGRRGGGRVRAGAGMASLFIYPGHDFRVIDGLLTNFHLPASSLLMLAAAFAGRERILAAYREAVRHRYRFYSYGDAMLIV